MSYYKLLTHTQLHAHKVDIFVHPHINRINRSFCVFYCMFHIYYAIAHVLLFVDHPSIHTSVHKAIKYPGPGKGARSQQSSQGSTHPAYMQDNKTLLSVSPR